ncbi:hypothetical protein T10_11199 [Trichinella papuae]|uniref:Uncharacterized protein n=1 Tax=Trichinella papuae TaxID=268474 RepID=A0A0V1MRX7_9BILA|nr:hypothetical protein T10_11199 [Trichinella papuae]
MNAFQQSINVIKLKCDEYLLEYNTTFNAIGKRYHDKQQQANESDQHNTRQYEPVADLISSGVFPECLSELGSFTTVREDLLVAGKRSIRCRDGTFLMSQFPLYRIHEFVAAVVVLATQKNTLLVHLPLLWSIPYSDASIAPKPTPSIYKLYLFTISGTDTEGKLSSKFTAADLQVISENLLSTDEVPDAEIPLITAVTKATGGQGYVKCMSRSGCSSGRSEKRRYEREVGLRQHRFRDYRSMSGSAERALPC